MSYPLRHTISEEALVQLLLSRDGQAMEIIYDRYNGALFGIISRIVPDKEIAEDLLQETFVKVWKNATQYSPAKGRLFTWMVNIARHLAIDKLRSKEFKNSSQNQTLDKHVSNIEVKPTEAINPELIGVKDLINKLNPDQKKVIDLIYFGGLTQEEVSDKLGIPLGTVKTRCRTALMILRKEFEVESFYK